MESAYSLDNFFDDLMVVLVIYKMEISESSTFKSLTSALQSINQKTSIFIYDNSPEAHTHTQAHLVTRNQNWVVNYRNDPTNPGVSKAYNEGFEFARSQQKEWILLVDQDTVFPIDTFEQYRKCLQEFNCPIVVPQLIDRVGMASPLKLFFGGGQRQKNLRPGRLLKLKDFFFHNSGLLISTSEFERAGKYDENIPLDFSDFSFVHRLRKRNSIFAVANITCSHSLATTSTSNLDQRLLRFASYLAAAHYFKKKYRPSDWMLSARLLLRALKLTFQYRNFQFLVLYFR